MSNRHSERVSHGVVHTDQIGPYSIKTYEPDGEHPAMRTATEAVDYKRLAQRRGARAICDALRLYIPDACKLDAEVHLAAFFDEHNVSFVSTEQSE